jgi:hypothetical protein
MEFVCCATGLQLRERIPSKVCEGILRNGLNLNLVLILALMKIRPRIEVQAYQKQAQSSE